MTQRVSEGSMLKNHWLLILHSCVGQVVQCRQGFQYLSLEFHIETLRLATLACFGQEVVLCPKSDVVRLQSVIW